MKAFKTRLLERLQIAVAGAALLALTGCQSDPYCFNCVESGSGLDGGSGGSGPGGVIVVGGSSGSGGESGSDGRPNPCGADLENDLENCGVCGHVCEIPNAFAQCVGGFCIVDDCAPGRVDLDGAVENGCEYECTPTTTGGGEAIELCDGIDNDCNGQIDETFNTDTDELNCGACGNICTIPHAQATCTAGLCVPDVCNVGFHDDNGDLNDVPTDGCEYACTVTNSGFEVCDLVDNDCDQEIDEGIDTQTDVENCGSCGNDCRDDFPSGTATCNAGACEFAGCQPGHYDIDGNALNGCEYPCVPDADPTEICDGRDNDCNGVSDEGTLPGVGDTCGNAQVGECRPGTRACLSGGLVCVGEVKPATEYCDGLDNDCASGPDQDCPTANGADQRLDVGGSSDVGEASTSQLTVAAQGTNVFAAYLDRRSGDADVRYTLSTDSGGSWRATDIGVATSGSDEVEPSLFASSSRVYVAYEKFSGSYRRIYVKSASGGFTSFGSESRADNTPSKNDAFYVRGVVASSGGGNDTLVLVWQRLDVEDGSRDIYLQRSTNNGVAWLGSDVRVNSVAGGADLPRIATDGNGKVFVAWRDQRNNKSEVFFATYDAGTDTLGANRALSGGMAGANPTVAADATGNVHVAWTDLRGTKKAIRVSSSTNSGAAFPSDGRIVNPDSTFADANHPALAAEAGRVVVAWEDTRSGLSDIRANLSVDGGSTWLSQTPRVDLGSVAGTASSLAPSVAWGAGDTVFVAWADTRNGRADIYSNHSNDAGRSFQPIDIRLDVGGPSPSAPSAAGAVQSQQPFVLAPGAGARGVVIWLDHRTSGGGSGTNADVYANYFD